MKKIFGLAAASALGVVCCIALTNPAPADVVVNNVFSPGSVTVVGPDYYSGYDGYSYRRRYYRSEYNEPRYYEPRYEQRYYEQRYYEQRNYEPRYYRSEYYGRRGSYCWVTTDKDRNFGYWDWCR